MGFTNYGDRYQIQFKNKYIVSMGQGFAHYVTGRDAQPRVAVSTSNRPHKSCDVEVAIIAPDGAILDFGGDSMKGWCSPEFIARLLAEVSTWGTWYAPSDTHGAHLALASFLSKEQLRLVLKGDLEDEV